MIVFDRVRENIPLMRHATVAQIINTSVWETVRRSLATTFITLLPVGALFFFGGDTLKDFAFAILIGISISAFSTLFIAAPFLAVLLERAPEFKRQGMQAGASVKPVVSVGTPEPVEPAIGTPAVAAAATVTPADAPRSTGESSQRERRRQRRSGRRPHGRAR